MSTTPPTSMTFAFDLDGVIGEYHGFQGENILGLPNKEVVDAMRALRARGHKIIIFSTHSAALLREYCEKHNIPFDGVNENPAREGGNKGKPIAHVYIDDRAYNYHGQTALELIHNLENFKPYWKK